jgi:hypothetical protein
MHASRSVNAEADAPPSDADAGIDQHNGPIEKYCWILRKSSGVNNVYRCKLCLKEFAGSKIVAATHFDQQVSTQQLRKCQAQKPAGLLRDLGSSPQPVEQSSGFEHLYNPRF